MCKHGRQDRLRVNLGGRLNEEVGLGLDDFGSARECAFTEDESCAKCGRNTAGFDCIEYCCVLHPFGAHPDKEFWRQEESCGPFSRRGSPSLARWTPPYIIWR